MTDYKNNLYLVDNPEIDEVFEIKTGEHYPVQKIISNDYDEVEKLRMELSESIITNNPKYLCPICHVAIYLVCLRNNNKKRFYFRHSYEDGSCPAVTRSEMSKDEIEARKYNGVKESPAHFEIKNVIAESLRNDKNFSKIKVEEVWKGQDRTTWRKPDVQALWNGTTPIAFEVQLSTTFLHVIAQRRLFYKEEGGLVCWIFKSFKKDSAKMTQDDVFYNNNHNLFLASDKTLKASKERQSLVLDCHWTEPVAINGTVSEEWNSRYTNFNELTQDLNRQRIYLFDYDNQKTLLTTQANTEALKQRFYSWWCSCNGDPISDDSWKQFQKEFKAKNIYMPDYPNTINSLLNALYSAREGKSVGWKHEKLISVAHLVSHLKHNNKYILIIFRVALLVYNRAGQIVEEDKEGKWIQRSNEFRKHLYSDPSYKRDERLDGLIAFLFPELMDREVWDRLKAIDENHHKKVSDKLITQE